MALHKRLIRLGELREYIDAHPRGPGSARLRRVVELAEPKAESAMETRLRLLLVQAGLPRPQAQVPLYDDRRRFLGRPDLYYPDQRLAIEYDGGTHRDRLAADDSRQNRLMQAGIRLLRFTASDVLRTPEATTALVAGLLKS